MTRLVPSMMLACSLALPAAVRAEEARPTEPAAQADQGQKGQASQAPADAEARQRAEATLREQVLREQALRTEVAELQQQTRGLEQELEGSRARMAELEQALASVEADRRAAARDPAVRAAQLETTAGALAQAQSALTAGSSDVEGALRQAQTLLAAVNERAGARGSGTEAALAAGAASDIDTAALALQRSSLFEARVALARATMRAQEALGIAGRGQAQPQQQQAQGRTGY